MNTFTLLKSNKKTETKGSSSLIIEETVLPFEKHKQLGKRLVALQLLVEGIVQEVREAYTKSHSTLKIYEVKKKGEQLLQILEDYRIALHNKSFDENSSKTITEDPYFLK